MESTKRATLTPTLRLSELPPLRYEAYQGEGASRFNRIEVNDFWYMEKLGEGAFGKVVSPWLDAHPLHGTGENLHLSGIC